MVLLGAVLSIKSPEIKKVRQPKPSHRKTRIPGLSPNKTLTANACANYQPWGSAFLPDPLLVIFPIEKEIILPKSIILHLHYLIKILFGSFILPHRRTFINKIKIRSVKFMERFFVEICFASFVAFSRQIWYN
ncbi:MAG: hypothetical protein IJF43_01450 [Firmicutes bacterium]|nr:hypothetical protein [Bacillota bacterium]